MRRLVAYCVIATVAACAAPPAVAAETAAQQGMTALRQFNVYTLGDLNAAQHVQGKVWVGGNLNGNLTVAQGGGGYLASPYAELTVKGDASATIKVEQSQTVGRSGSLVQIGGSSTGEVGLNGAGGHVDTGGTFSTTNFNASPSKTYTAGVPGLQAQIALATTDFSNDFLALSTTLKALPSTTITNMGSALSVTGDYGVFSMTKAQFQTSNENFDTLFNGIGSDKTIIINVLGTGAFTEDGGGNNNALGLAANIIWNFADASSVSVKNWAGSILAPNATVTNSSTITGSVVSRLFFQNGEVHLSTFAGTARYLPAPPPATVPEPASWMTMLLGFGFAGSIIRRQRRRGCPAAA